MVNYRMIAVASFLASVNGLPLNINLGAYSPALVVGDGEISFGGGQDVTNLLNALEGAAVTGATANSGATNGAAQDIQTLDKPSDPTPTESTVAAQGSESAVATPVATTAAVDPNLQEQGTQAKTYIRYSEETKLTHATATQISALQGMGKEIAPRDETEKPKVKRDLQGFDRALTYAEAALTKGPIIQLGTGEGGAGVGIIVDNRPNAAAAPAGEDQATAKRDEGSQPRRRTKNSPDFETRSVEPLPALNLPALSKRDNSDAIDAINLNIPADEGVTMTFVETTDDDEASEATASE
ncbi:hypothetical protein FHL15_003724 [Xylaria flabelliformis]|uniref:SMP domain-containing protein n=1 Tax=Xylaria flabelliformis TaxID=2512241 RepID=A0A553I5C8_9PEZI|nr:hypothetical protein FHL15_003724 [Xylaria flabelliformis]